MISEQSANADGPGKTGLTKRGGQGFTADNPFDQGEKKRDEKGGRDDLERLYFPGQRRQDREGPP